jgi:hypothetical protein
VLSTAGIGSFGAGVLSLRHFWIKGTKAVILGKEDRITNGAGGVECDDEATRLIREELSEGGNDRRFPNAFGIRTIARRSFLAARQASMWSGARR